MFQLINSRRTLSVTIIIQPLISIIITYLIPSKTNTLRVNQKKGLKRLDLLITLLCRCSEAVVWLKIIGSMQKAWATTNLADTSPNKKMRILKNLHENCMWSSFDAPLDATTSQIFMSSFCENLRKRRYSWQRKKGLSSIGFKPNKSGPFRIPLVRWRLVTLTTLL